MHKFKEIMKDNAFMRRSVFIIFNVFLLYVLYFVIKNITIVTTTLGNGLSVLFSAFWPLILGLILAYLLNPLVSLIDNKLICKVIRPGENPVISAKRKKRSRKLSILLTFIIVFVAFVGIIYGFTIMIIGKFPISDLTNVMQDMLSNITTYEKGFKGWVANNFPDGVVYDKMMDFTNSIMGWLSENVSVTSVMAFFKGIGGSIVNFVIALIISIYLMADREFFLGLWNKFIKLLFPNKGQGVISTSLSDVNDVLSKFIRGALLDALIVATLSSIGLSLMGLEAAVFIGVFAGLANVIPYFGPVLGMIPAFLMGLATGGFLARSTSCVNFIYHPTNRC